MARKRQPLQMGPQQVVGDPNAPYQVPGDATRLGVDLLPSPQQGDATGVAPAWNGPTGPDDPQTSSYRGRPFDLGQVPMHQGEQFGPEYRPGLQAFGLGPNPDTLTPGAAQVVQSHPSVSVGRPDMTPSQSVQAWLAEVGGGNASGGRGDGMASAVTKAALGASRPNEPGPVNLGGARVTKGPMATDPAAPIPKQAAQESGAQGLPVGDEMRRAANLSGWMGLANTLGQQFAGAASHVSGRQVESPDLDAEAPMKHLMTMRQGQQQEQAQARLLAQQDPKSEESQRVQKMLSQLPMFQGMDMSGVSAAQFPKLSEAFELQGKLEEKKTEAASRHEDVQARIKASAEEARQRALDRGESRRQADQHFAESMGVKLHADQEKQAEKLRNAETGAADIKEALNEVGAQTTPTGDIKGTGLAVRALGAYSPTAANFISDDYAKTSSALSKALLGELEARKLRGQRLTMEELRKSMGLGSGVSTAVMKQKLGDLYTGARGRIKEAEASVDPSAIALHKARGGLTSEDFRAPSDDPVVAQVRGASGRLLLKRKSGKIEAAP